MKVGYNKDSFLSSKLHRGQFLEFLQAKANLMLLI